jgi:hypothetical protein
MYKVRYYTTGEILVSKTFSSLAEATLFAVYKIKTGDVYAIDKVD